MRSRSNPFFRGGLSAAFSRPAVLRAYTYYLAAMSATLFFWWPRASLAACFRDGSAPPTFAAAAVGLLACLAYLSVRFGAEDYSKDDANRVREFATLTPVPVRTVVAGQAALGAVHTLFLLVLGLPFLALSLGVSGVPPAAAAAALLVAGTAALAFRALGFLLFALFESRPALKTLLLFLCPLLFIVLPLLIAPQASPLTAVLGLGSYGLSPGALTPEVTPSWGIAAAVDLAAAAALAAGAAFALAAARRRET